MNDFSVSKPLLVGTVTSISSLTALEPKWRAHEARCQCSFFLSWSWRGPWLRTVQWHCSLQLYECRDGTELVALGILGEKTITRRKTFRSHTLSLNEVGGADPDMFIEYNGLLTQPGYQSSALQQWIEDLAVIDHAWDELRLSHTPSELVHSLRTDRLRALAD
jgi:hypothetical protein